MERRAAIWTPRDEAGTEVLSLIQQENTTVAAGLIVSREAVLFRADYTILYDSKWCTRGVGIFLLKDFNQAVDNSSRTLVIKADGLGHWTTGEGEPVPLLDGCLDVDISASAFTNTLPIRRLNLAVGESAELIVAYIALPELTLRVDKQRYTFLERRELNDVYRYEGLTTDFVADIVVDRDGLVVDYPGLFKRVWI
jgi:hypothetical protein